MNGEGGNKQGQIRKGFVFSGRILQTPDITILNFSAPKSLQMNGINKTQFLEFNPLYFGVTFFHVYAQEKGEGNGTPLQYSCLENPMGGGAWWAAVLVVAKSPDMTERLHFHFSLSCIGEGDGNPLQCSCRKNPRDGGAWWAAVYGVTQGRTRLKQLCSSSSGSSRKKMPAYLNY